MERIGNRPFPQDIVAERNSVDTEISQRTAGNQRVNRRRSLGFDAYQSTRSSFTDVFDELRARRIIPA